jgi:hypothetical protein
VSTIIAVFHLLVIKALIMQVLKLNFLAFIIRLHNSAVGMSQYVKVMSSFGPFSRYVSHGRENTIELDYNIS